MPSRHQSIASVPISIHNRGSGDREGICSNTHTSPGGRWRKCNRACTRPRFLDNLAEILEDPSAKRGYSIFDERLVHIHLFTVEQVREQVEPFKIFVPGAGSFSGSAM